MTLLHSNAPQRSVRRRGTSALATVLAVMGLVAGGVLASPDAAAAAEFAIATPSATLFPSSTVTLTGAKAVDGRVEIPSLSGGDPYCIEGAATESWSCTFTLPDGTGPVTVKQYPANPGDPVVEASVTIRVLGAPSIDGAEPLLTTGIISGAGLGGAGVLVSGTGPETFSTSCTTVQVGGYWSCPLPVTTSGSYSVTVQQLWEGTGEPGGSATRTVTVDKIAPGIPALTQPTAGATVAAQPATYAGTGENGARVDVFVDSALVCSATVTGTAWSCAASGVSNGSRLVQAIQWDAAGNPSGVGAGVRVTFGPATGGGTTPVTPATPPTPQAPAQPAPVPGPGQQSAPSPGPIPQQSLPFFPPPVGGTTSLPPLDTWGTPTNYGAAIVSVTSADWLLSLTLAVAFIVLIALPMRLWATTLRGRAEPRVARLAAHNRRVRPDDKPIFSAWTVAAIALASAIALAALAGGIQAEARYLRLIIAIGIALLVLNWVGVALVTKTSSRAMGSPTGMRLVPAILAVAAITALLSRGGGIQPPVIVGVVIAARFAAEAGARTRGLVGLTQLLALTMLGFWAWLGTTVMGPQAGFVPLLVSEALSALCMAAFGSLLLLLLPVGTLPGRDLFDWSWPAWLATTLVAATAATAVIATSTTFPLLWVLGAAVLFAVVSLAAWSWVRYVEPQLLEA